MKYEDHLAIVDFLYFGEANILQEHFYSLLNIAEELQLKGLNVTEGGGGREGVGGHQSWWQAYNPKVPSNEGKRINDTISILF